MKLCDLNLRIDDHYNNLNLWNLPWQFSVPCWRTQTLSKSNKTIVASKKSSQSGPRSSTEATKTVPNAPRGWGTFKRRMKSTTKLTRTLNTPSLWATTSSPTGTMKSLRLFSCPKSQSRRNHKLYLSSSPLPRQSNANAPEGVEIARATIMALVGPTLQSTGENPPWIRLNSTLWTPW